MSELLKRRDELKLELKRLWWQQRQAVTYTSLSGTLHDLQCESKKLREDLNSINNTLNSWRR